MITTAPRRGAVLLALGFTLSCIGLMIFVWTQFGGAIPFAPQGYRVNAVFAETGLLVPGADVRIAGVNVGRVTAVAPRGVDSLVSMDLTQRYAPIPLDTRAILRQKTLLGEAYVELTPGDRAAAKIPDGGAIPSAQVAPTQQLDRVLAAFGKPAQQNFEAFLAGGGVALAGRGEEISSALGNLDPASAALAQILEVLDRERGSVGSLVRNSAVVLETLGQRSGDLETLIRTGDEVLAATAGRNTALTATIDALTPFLARLRVTLAATGTTLTLAKPSLDALLPAAPLVRPALADLIALSGPAVSLLRRAPRLIDDAIVALPAIARFNTAFHPALDALLPAVRQVAPIVDYIGLYRRELVTAMANLAATLQGSAPAETTSGSASYLRAMSAFGNGSAFGQSVRGPTERNNTYFAPGELAYAARGGLLAASCANLRDTAQASLGFGNVPCRVQPGFAFSGLTRYFPHLTQAAVK